VNDHKTTQIEIEKTEYVRISYFLIVSFTFLCQSLTAQTILAFQGGEIGDTWGYTSTGADAVALAEATNSSNYISGNNALVVGGNTPGGSCISGGSGNGAAVLRQFIFDQIQINTSNSFNRTLTFHYGNRFPVCVGTGWDAGEDLVFTAYHDGISQPSVTLQSGNNNLVVDIATHTYTWTIPTCVSSFSFKLEITTNRRDELLFIDDVALTTPQLNPPFPALQSIIGDTILCINSSQTLSVSPIPNTSFTWTGIPSNAQFTSPNGTQNSNQIQINWGSTPPGIYTITVTPSYSACNSSIEGNPKSIAIALLDSQTLSMSPNDTICAGDSILISAVSNSTLLWDQGLGIGNQFWVSPSSSTLYTAITATGNCQSSGSVSIVVNLIPTINAGVDQEICQGGFCTLNASGGLVYQWSPSIVNGSQITPTETTTYFVEGISAEGCVNTDSITITVVAHPIVDFNVDITGGCIPFSVQFENLTSNGATFQWDFGDGFQSNTENPIHEFTTTGCKDVSLTVNWNNGCSETKLSSSLICPDEYPIAAFTVSPPTINEFNQTIYCANNSINATNYSWNFGDNAVTNDENPFHTYTSDETENGYTITLQVSSEHGCVDSISVFLPYESQTLFYIPNSFTPDGDEYNQVFKPLFTQGIDPTNFHLSIYDRWGQFVFESFDYSIGWDGTNGLGELVSDGEYSWTIFFHETHSEQTRFIKGHVNVLK
jgi:gliding motility-associated-like protein